MLFWWTGAIFWASLVTITAATLFVFFVSFLLGLTSTLMQELWVKRSGIPRNDVSFWAIVRQDMFDGWGDQVQRIIRYARWAWTRRVPLITPPYGSNSKIKKNS